MPLFDIPKKQNNSSKTLLDRVKGDSPPPVLMKKGSASAAKSGDINSRINTITTMVTKYLGKYKDDYLVIRDEGEFKDYIDKCIKTGYISIDTETGGLNPLIDEIAGLCIYTPGEKAAYIPIGHISLFTGTALKNQLSKEICRHELERLKDSGVKVIMHNAKFDIRVIKNRLGVVLPCYWDTLVASVLLNENEPHGLKKLHAKYVLDGKEDAFSFDELFDGFNFQYLPINTGYIYAARDALITWELFKFQEPYLTKGTQECIDYDLERVCNVFWNIEMPLIPVLVDLEDTGTAFDFSLVEEFSTKYHNELDRVTKEFYAMLEDYSKEIESYRRIQGFNCKLEDPINIGSPAQIAILLYDIMKLESPKGGRGTGEDVLQSLKNPICEKILEYREYVKHIGTYVDKLPQSVNPITHRIHAKFNASGAATGRFSSSDPNCIAEGTKVIGPGYEKNIEDIEVGDYVYCYDPNTGKAHIRKVLNTWYKGIKQCVKVTWRSTGNWKYGEVLMTPDHKVLTQDCGFIPADKLVVGQKVYHITKGETDKFIYLYGGPGAFTEKGFSEIPEHQFIENEYSNTSSKMDIQNIGHLWNEEIPSEEVQPFSHQIASIEKVGEYPVYDIEVDDCHTFIANGICVSNCQNIPSRGPKSAVRRYFKATDDVIDLSTNVVSNEIISSKGYTKDIITLKDGTRKHLEDLRENDIIVLKDGKKDIHGMITSISLEDIYINFSIKIIKEED